MQMESDTTRKTEPAPPTTDEMRRAIMALADAMFSMWADMDRRESVKRKLDEVYSLMGVPF